MRGWEEVFEPGNPLPVSLRSHPAPRLLLGGPAGVLALQRAVGNAAVTRLIEHRRPQLQRACCASCASGQTCESERDREALAGPGQAVGPERAADAAFGAQRFQDDERLLAALHNSPPLRLGESSSAVAVVQQALADIGYELPRTMANGSADGIYGRETTAAVRDFQHEFGVHPVGGSEVGHKTLSALDVMFRDASGATDEAAPQKLVDDQASSKAKGAPIDGPPVASVVEPVDPRKPNDLKRFRCKSPRTLRIDLYFASGESVKRANDDVAHARRKLSEHNVRLDIRFFRLATSTNFELKTEDAWCDFVTRTIALNLHDASRLPVFFAPAKFIRAADAGVTYLSLKTTCGDTFSRNTDVDRAVLVDCCSGCPPGVLLHELGHAVGDKHIVDTFMHPECGAIQSRADILPSQLKNAVGTGFCLSPF